ncbi:MAG: exonuclease domain-containing protein [Firmicutes bacterium]|nr:exonuclease domain-containing protein [Bacillota bacterium]
MGPYVVIDVETTGLDPQKDRIIQIALRRSDGTAWSSFVNPGRSIPETVRQLTKVGDRDFAQDPPFSALRQTILDWIRDARVVGHNIGFDAAFLRTEGIRLLNPLDTLWWSRLAFPLRTQHGLADWFPDAVETLHDARRDVELTERLLKIIYERCAAMSTSLKQDLARFLGPEWDWWDVPEEHAGHRISPLYRPEPDVFQAEPLAISPTTEGPAERLDRIGQAQAIPFERRPGQDAMLQAVDTALNSGRILFAQAGTGTGKSFAYLIPSLLKAMTTGERVVVATHTVALQEQLWEKDLPQARGDWPLEMALVKGRGRYVCLYKVAELVQSSAVLADTPQRRGAIATLLTFLEETDAGDLDHMAMTDEAAWAVAQEVVADRHSCAGARCPYSGPCFMRRAHHAAESSHLVVVNHALLAAHHIFGGVLPSFSHLIVDEAHHWADVVEEMLGFSLDLEHWGRRLREATHPRYGVLSKIRQDFDEGELWEAVRDYYHQAHESLTRWAEALVAVTPASEYDRRAVRVTPSLTDVFEDAGVQDLREATLGVLTDLVRAATECLDKASIRQVADEPRWLKFRQWLEELTQVSDGLQLWGQDSEERVSWWEVLTDRQGLPVVRWRWAPVDIRDFMRRQLWSTIDSAVLTSATLAVHGRFDYMAERLGVSPERRMDLLVSSPFNWSEQARLVIPQDVPHPDDPRYNDVLAHVVRDAAVARGGRTLVLLTSYRAVERLAWRIREPLQEAGIRTLAQNVDGSARRLVTEFRRHPTSVLIGTLTYWEGVDLPGDDLEIVIMGRLPFRAPGDPLEEAKCERLRRAGLSPFYHRSIPEAVLRFQQGFGRLIRTNRDRGIVIVFDPRIRPEHSRYGRFFLESLPDVPAVTVPAAEIVRVIEEFWGSAHAYSH